MAHIFTLSSTQPSTMHWQILIVSFVTLSLQVSSGQASAADVVQYKVNQQDHVYNCSMVQNLDGISSIVYQSNSSNNPDEEITPCTCAFYTPQTTNNTDVMTPYLNLREKTCSGDNQLADTCDWSDTDTYSQDMWADTLTVEITTRWTSNTSTEVVLVSDVFDVQDYPLPAMLVFGPAGITYSMRCGPSSDFNSSPGVIQDLHTTQHYSDIPRPTVLMAIMLTIGICFFLGILTLVIFIVCRRQKKQAKCGQHPNRFIANVRVNSYDHVIQAYDNEGMACSNSLSTSKDDLTVKYPEFSNTPKSIETLGEGEADNTDAFTDLQLPVTSTKQTLYTMDNITNTNQPSEKMYASENINGYNEKNTNALHKSVIHDNGRNVDTIDTSNTVVGISRRQHTDISSHILHHPQTFTVTRPSHNTKSSSGTTEHPKVERYGSSTTNTPNCHNQGKEDSQDNTFTYVHEKPSIYQIPAGYGTLRASKSVEEKQEPHYANVWVTKSRTRARSFNSSDKPSHYADIDIAKLKRKQPSIRYTFSQEDEGSQGKQVNYVDLDLPSAKSNEMSTRSSAYKHQVKLTPEEVAELYAVPVKLKRKATTKENGNTKQGEERGKDRQLREQRSEVIGAQANEISEAERGFDIYAVPMKLKQKSTGKEKSKSNTQQGGDTDHYMNKHRIPNQERFGVIGSEAKQRNTHEELEVHQRNETMKKHGVRMPKSNTEYREDLGNNKMQNEQGLEVIGSQGKGRSQKEHGLKVMGYLVNDWSPNHQGDAVDKNAEKIKPNEGPNGTGSYIIDTSQNPEGTGGKKAEKTFINQGHREARGKDREQAASRETVALICDHSKTHGKNYRQVVRQEVHGINRAASPNNQISRRDNKRQPNLLLSHMHHTNKYGGTHERSGNIGHHSDIRNRQLDNKSRHRTGFEGNVESNREQKSIRHSHHRNRPTYQQSGRHDTDKMGTRQPHNSNKFVQPGLNYEHHESNDITDSEQGTIWDHNTGRPGLMPGQISTTEGEVDAHYQYNSQLVSDCNFHDESNMENGWSGGSATPYHTEAVKPKDLNDLNMEKTVVPAYAMYI